MPRGTVSSAISSISRAASSAIGGSSKGSTFVNGVWVSPAGSAALPQAIDSAISSFSSALGDLTSASGAAGAVSRFLENALGLREGALQRVVATYTSNLLEKHFNSASFQDSIQTFTKQIVKYGMSQAKTSSLMPNFGAGVSAARNYAKGLVKSTFKSVILGEAFNAIDKELRGTKAEKGWNYYQRARKNSSAAKKRTNSRLYNRR